MKELGFDLSYFKQADNQIILFYSWGSALSESWPFTRGISNYSDVCSLRHLE